MIWVYTVTGSNDLLAKDVGSVEELKSLSREDEWFWVDFMEPTEEEFKTFSEFLGETLVIKDLRKQKIFARPETIKNYILFSIPQIVFTSGLKTLPIYVLIKDKIFVTVRNRYSSKPVKQALKTFEDCVGKICEDAINSSFILSRLFHEISNENLEVVMTLRENIDKIEEKALRNPADKKISRSVFATKREVSALERVLWSQRELMISVSEGVIPTLKTTEEIRAALSHPINNISRELSLLDSHNSALDSILSLQDLGMIHRVEKNLIRLTLIALFVSVLLILLEIDIIALLSR